MFQFRRFPSYSYLIHCTILEYCSSVLPHSDISGSTLICSSPKLFAACHVLHRLLMPRHSPCALISLTFSRTTYLNKLFSRFYKNYAGTNRFIVVFCYPLFKKSTKNYLCYLSVACSQFLACFTVQFSRCRFFPTFFKVRLKCSAVWQNTSI